MGDLGRHRFKAPGAFLRSSSRKFSGRFLDGLDSVDIGVVERCQHFGFAPEASDLKGPQARRGGSGRLRGPLPSSRPRALGARNTG